MSTLLYAPAVQIRIATNRHGIIDVSDDIVRGSVSMAEGEIGNLSFVLNNERRKYDGVFTPNDRISVRMKRIAWVQVFSGYLNSVPYKSIFPREVPLTASCTMKRLLYSYWDPNSSAAHELLNLEGGRTGSQRLTDGGLRDRLIRLLVEVGRWPQHTIHVGALPSRWYEKVKEIEERLRGRIEVDVDALGAGTVVGGQSLPEALGTRTLPSAGPMTGVLPALSGRISWFGGPQGGAYGSMALTGESGVTPRDQWYCAMRWPYAHYVNGKITMAGPSNQVANARSWWKNRKILVVNPTTNKAVVLRAADWGPGGVRSADLRAIDVSRHALNVLGAKTDSHVEIRFADPALPLGEVTGKGMILTRPDPLGEAHPITAAPDTMQGPTGVRFVSADRLQPHVAAAREWIFTGWPEARKHSMGGYSVRNIKGTGTPSDHSFGLALDVGISARSINGRTPQQLAHGTSVAQWFVANPDAFGTKYVIWNNRINSGNGWKLYAGGKWSHDINQGHFNHVHISFKNAAQGAPTRLGPMGNPWPGADMAGFPDFTPLQGGAVGSADPVASHEGDNLIKSFLWQMNMPSVESSVLTGLRALMNDRPLFGSVKAIADASMRSIMAAPNGDFIAWFPDYFGTYKTAGRMVVKDVEMAGDGFTLTWDDSRLKTHMYATGSWAGVGPQGTGAGAVDVYNRAVTSGIATVEFPEIMEALFNIDPNDPRAKDMLDAETILQRYGARPEVVDMGEISGKQAEFWLALRLFQQNWAKQFSARVELTFMPEVYPGMLLYLEAYGLQVYVTGVSHTFDFESGFHTSVTVVAPSATNGSGLFGLPRAVVS